jgi:hypothetical protein
MDRGAGRGVAAVRRLVTAALTALSLAACGKLQDFGGPAPPLASFEVMFDGDLAPLRPPGDTGERSLRLALVWGAQWLTERFCVPGATPATTTAESDAAAAVRTAGCRPPFGFVPQSVAASVPLTLGAPTTLTLDQLPSTDVLVGDATARMAYGSFVVFDDRNGNMTLDLTGPRREPSGGDGERGGNLPESPDVIFGASFLTSTAADHRVAYREGNFHPGWPYPRSGCPAPMPGFRVLAAGGFSEAAGLAATAGQFPAEDPATCSDSAPDATVIDIQAQAPADVEEVGCVERTNDGSTRYSEPPSDDPTPGRRWACTHLPTFDTGAQSDLIQLVIAERDTDQCKGLTHYTLRGCREGATCVAPDWDHTAMPPMWWPCQHP